MTSSFFSTGLKSIVAASGADPRPLERPVDLARYTGEWFCYSAIPSWFQPPEAINVRATYKMNESGTMMLVANQQHLPDGICESAWEAWSWNAAACPTNEQNSTMKFRMGGQYWILELDTDNYQWAVVGSPGRTKLWVLTREAGKWPASAKVSYQRVLEMIEDVHMYDAGLLEMTTHDTSESGSLPAAEFPDTSRGADTMKSLAAEAVRPVKMMFRAV